MGSFRRVGGDACALCSPYPRGSLSNSVRGDGASAADANATFPRGNASRDSAAVFVDSRGRPVDRCGCDGRFIQRRRSVTAKRCFWRENRTRRCRNSRRFFRHRGTRRRFGFTRQCGFLWHSTFPRYFRTWRRWRTVGGTRGDSRSRASRTSWRWEHGGSFTDSRVGRRTPRICPWGWRE